MVRLGGKGHRKYVSWNCIKGNKTRTLWKLYIYIYIHTYMYTHTYIYTHTHTHAHIGFFNAYLYIYIFFLQSHLASSATKIAKHSINTQGLKHFRKALIRSVNGMSVFGEWPNYHRASSFPLLHFLLIAKLLAPLPVTRKKNKDRGVCRKQWHSVLIHLNLLPSLIT